MKEAALSSTAVGRKHDRQVIVRMSDEQYARLKAYAESETERTRYTVTVADVIRKYVDHLPVTADAAPAPKRTKR